MEKRQLFLEKGAFFFMKIGKNKKISSNFASKI